MNEQRTEVARGSTAGGTLHSCAGAVRDFVRREGKNIKLLQAKNERLTHQNQLLRRRNMQLLRKLNEKKTAETWMADCTLAQDPYTSSDLTDLNVVRAVQKALEQYGYECGKTNGRMGEKMRTAIKLYEGEQRLTIDGRITKKLIETLGITDQVNELLCQRMEMKRYDMWNEYPQMQQNPEYYVGMKIQQRGRVLQEGNIEEDIKYLILVTDLDQKQLWYITYPEKVERYMIFRDDVVTIYGVCMGEYFCETLQERNGPWPWLHADMIDMSEVEV